MRRPFLPLLALASTAALALGACGDDSKPSPDTTDAADTSDAADTLDDTSDAADTVDDTSDARDSGADTAADDAQADTSADAADTADVDPNPWGFDIRVPEQHNLTCSGNTSSEPLVQLDSDWLCTLNHGETKAHVYLQADATACVVIFTPLPEFGAARGWSHNNGTLAAVSDVAYDWGGNHHNDSLRFVWEGRDYTYYHSSFGFGWRQCQPMDCLQVRDLEGNMIEDGCTADRTLPAVCRQIGADGTWEPLVDTFEPCLGDPNR